MRPRCLVAALCLCAARAEHVASRRHLTASPTEFKEQGDILDKILDEGEAAQGPGHKGKKVKKKVTAESAVEKEKKKEMQEVDVKVDLGDVEKKLPVDIKPLTAAPSGKVDKAVEIAEASREEEKALKKEAKKTKDPELLSKVEADREENELKLTLHECGKIQKQVAYLVPATPRSLERAIAMLVSFERMGYGAYGDIKFIFDDEQTVATYAEELPKLLRRWNVTDVPAHRVAVELKENAIVFGEKPQKVVTALTTDYEHSARFVKAVKRLHGLAHLLDTQPCDYKFSVLLTCDSRFLYNKALNLKAATEGKQLAEAGNTAGGGKEKANKEPWAPKALPHVEKKEANEHVKDIVRMRRLQQNMGMGQMGNPGGGGPGPGGGGGGMGQQQRQQQPGGQGGGGQRMYQGGKGGNGNGQQPPPSGGGIAGMFKKQDPTKKAQTPEEKDAKKEAKVEFQELARTSNPVVSLLTDYLNRKTVWGHNCNATQGDNAAMRLARQRSEANARIFSGGDKSPSPRFAALETQTQKFDLVTLQSQLPVVEMKKRASRFLLELYRASGSHKECLNFKCVINALVESIPDDLVHDLSDVLLYQYFTVIRGDYNILDTSSFGDVLASCKEVVALSDALALVPDKQGLLKLGHRFGIPFMVPRGFSNKGIKAILPIVEYERSAFDYSDGESIY